MGFELQSAYHVTSQKRNIKERAVKQAHSLRLINDLEGEKKIGSFSLIERVILSAGAMLIFSVYFHLTICPEGRKDILKVRYNLNFGQKNTACYFCQQISQAVIGLSMLDCHVEWPLGVLV